MPLILAALAAIIAIAAAMSMGHTLGTALGADMGFLIQLGAVPAIALVAIVGLWLYHRRRSRELIVARYHLQGDALGWRRVRLGTLEHVRVCAECGAIVPDYRAQEEHAGWHEDLAALIAGQPLAAAEQVPWSAITEPGATAPEPEPEPAEQLEQPDSGWRQVRDVFRLRRPPEPEPEPAEQLEQSDEVGEWEAKARKFRASMDRIRTGGPPDGDS